jgi:hypothetical protein
VDACSGCTFVRAPKMRKMVMGEYIAVEAVALLLLQT